MKFIEALEGAESHYEREEFLPAIALMLVGFGRLIEENADEDDDDGWKIEHHSLCLNREHDPTESRCYLSTLTARR